MPQPVTAKKLKTYDGNASKTASGSGSGSANDETENAKEEANAKEEQKWYSNVAVKREEGHRSGWMNRCGILLARLNRGERDKVKELQKQQLGSYQQHFLFFWSVRYFFFCDKPINSTQVQCPPCNGKTAGDNQ